ncbi:MAG: hypothetical protein ACYC8V_15295 [Caulobacteraceae bacterium]
MRRFLAAAALLAVGGCDRNDHAGATGGPGATAINRLPGRRAGLWEEAVTRDGKPLGPGGKLTICLDAATDARIGMFGREMAGSLCRQRSVSRRPAGLWRFASTCSLGKAGVIASHGVASGDFSSNYRIRSESDVSGSSYPPMDGHHVNVVVARYLGPCPRDMAPGDMLVDGDVKINVNRLGAGAEALAGIGR